MAEIQVLELDEAPTFNRSLKALIASADLKDVPSGFLATLPAAPFGNGIFRDGIGFTDAIDQRQWETIYRELAASALPTDGRATFPAANAINSGRQDGAVPIGLVNILYHQPTRRLVARILDARSKDTEIALPDSDLVEERLAFAASAVLPRSYWGFERLADIHEGLDVRFVLAPEISASNAGEPDCIEIDFDDGNGFRRVETGDEQSVRYDEGGPRRITLRAQYGDETRIASFLFEAAPITAPSPAEIIRVDATIADQGKFRKCLLVVHLGKGNARITRPFLIAEGFGGSTPEAFFDRINGKVGTVQNPDARLADALIERGFDVILMHFMENGERIQGNAFAYLAALKVIWDRMGAKGTMIAAGGSMGGLIARYALAYAETNGVPIGNVQALMTFDSPHLGANVPLAVQCVSRYWHNDGGSETNLILDRPAAKQMLMAQRWSAAGQESIEKPEYAQFYRELAGLGVGGYPSRVKKYAVSNGSAKGDQGIQPLNPGVIWRAGGWHLPVAKAEAWAMPNGGGGSISWCQKLFHEVRYDVNGTAFGRDGCSGGTSPFFEQMGDAFRRRKPEAVYFARLSCFVPTYSSLGKWVQNAYTFRADSIKPQDTPFDDFYVPEVNQAHATIHKGSKEWVLKKLEAHSQRQEQTTLRPPFSPPPAETAQSHRSPA